MGRPLTHGGEEEYIALEMRGFLKDEFSPKNVVVRLMWAAITTGMLKLALYSFAVAPRREYLFWASMLALVFLAVTFISALSRQDGMSCFHVVLEEVMSGTGKDPQGNSITFTSVIAAVSNTGAPSVVSGMRFTAQVPGSVPVPGEAQTLPDSLTINLPNGHAETVSGSDALNIKVQLQPIPKGGIVRGRMLYTFAGVSVDGLGAVGTVYELVVTDLWGRKYKASIRNVGLKPQVLNYPQIRKRLPLTPEDRHAGE